VKSVLTLKELLLLKFLKWILLILAIFIVLYNIVNPPYNDMDFAAKCIVIKGVLLYLILIYKMHLKSKLGNNIISTPTKL
jgi:hypothetical protein